MSEPAEVERLVPNIGTDQVVREHQVLHVEVVGGPHGAAGHLVLGEQQRTRFEREISESALFMRLPRRRCLQRWVG